MFNFRIYSLAGSALSKIGRIGGICAGRVVGLVAGQLARREGGRYEIGRYEIGRYEIGRYETVGQWVSHCLTELLSHCLTALLPY